VAELAEEAGDGGDRGLALTLALALALALILTEEAGDGGDRGRAVGGEGERRDRAAEVLGARGELAAADRGQHDVGLARELGAVVLLRVKG